MSIRWHNLKKKKNNDEKKIDNKKKGFFCFPSSISPVM